MIISPLVKATKFVNDVLIVSIKVYVDEILHGKGWVFPDWSLYELDMGKSVWELHGEPLWAIFLIGNLLDNSCSHYVSVELFDSIEVSDGSLEGDRDAVFSVEKLVSWLVPVFEDHSLDIGVNEGRGVLFSMDSWNEFNPSPFTDVSQNTKVGLALALKLVLEHWSIILL